jgi:hypothetical protein
MLSQWLSQLDKNLVKRWRLGSLKVLARSVHDEWAVRLHRLRKRGRRGGFGDCHAWTRVQVLLLRFMTRYRQRPLLRLMPTVVIRHRLLFSYLIKTRRRKKKKKSRWSARIASTIVVVRGVVIFLLQLCRLLLVFRDFQYQTLIRNWKKSSPKICCQRQLLMISRPSVQRSQTVGKG